MTSIVGETEEDIVVADDVTAASGSVDIAVDDDESPDFSVGGV